MPLLAVPESVANRLIDACKVTQRLFDLSDQHVLMRAAREFESACDAAERQREYLGMRHHDDDANYE